MKITKFRIHTFLSVSVILPTLFCESLILVGLSLTSSTLTEKFCLRVRPPRSVTWIVMLITGSASKSISTSTKNNNYLARSMLYSDYNAMFHLLACHKRWLNGAVLWLRMFFSRSHVLTAMAQFSSPSPAMEMYPFCEIHPKGCTRKTITWNIILINLSFDSQNGIYRILV